MYDGNVATSAAFRPLAALALALAGCGGPSLALSFSIPSAYQKRVQTVSLELLAPTGSAFGCDDVAFSEVTPTTVDDARLQQVVANVGEHIHLSGIPRTGTKLFVARGLDKSGTAVVAGCAETGDVDSAVSLTITGEPATVLATAPITAPGAQLPSDVTATVTDITGAPLAGRTVRWSVTGAGGEQIDCPGQSGARVPCTETTDSHGVAHIAPPAPSLPGPAALDVRTRWQSVPAASILGYYDVPATYSTNLPGGAAIPTDSLADAYQIGRIGPNGETGLAVLSPRSDGTAVVLTAYYDATADPPYKAATSAPIAGAKALGVIAGQGRDRLFTITPAGWLEFGPDGALTTKASPAPGKTARRIVPAGGCGSGGDDVVLVEFDDGSMMALDQNRAKTTTPFLPRPRGSSLLASGCAADLDSHPHRVVVFGLGEFDQKIVADIDGRRVGDLISLQAGVGFLPAIGGAPPLLLGEDISVAGTSITRNRLVPKGNAGVDVEVVDQDDSTTVATSATGGDFDGDGLADVAAVLLFGQNTNQSPQTRLMISLGAEHRGERLEGVSKPLTIPALRVMAADFDGDGTDEMVLAGPTALAVFKIR